MLEQKVEYVVTIYLSAKACGASPEAVEVACDQQAQHYKSCLEQVLPPNGVAISDIRLEPYNALAE